MKISSARKFDVSSVANSKAFCFKLTGGKKLSFFSDLQTKAEIKEKSFHSFTAVERSFCKIYSFWFRERVMRTRISFNKVFNVVTVTVGSVKVAKIFSKYF